MRIRLLFAMLLAVAISFAPLAMAGEQAMAAAPSHHEMAGRARPAGRQAVLRGRMHGRRDAVGGDGGTACAAEATAAPVGRTIPPRYPERDRYAAAPPCVKIEPINLDFTKGFLT